MSSTLPPKDEGDSSLVVSQQFSQLHDDPQLNQALELDELYPWAKVEELLGYNFRDRNLLLRAFTHRSARSVKPRCDYERLEFIGDAVFDLAVAHLLSDKYQDASEGQLSKMRAALVKTASFAAIARRLSFGDFIRVSRSELANGANDRASILADVLEAVVGAIYLDGGFESARSCISRLLEDDIASVVPRDPKTELQELLHSYGGAPPVYRIECTEGPEHSPVFVSSVEINGSILGRGKGSTKKASQQIAAEEALTVLKLKREQHLVCKATNQIPNTGTCDENGKE